MRYRLEALVNPLTHRVVIDFLERVDPEEKRWPSEASIAPLRKALFEVIDAAIADWEIETEKAEGLSL
jgi:hypothetical protein